MISFALGVSWDYHGDVQLIAIDILANFLENQAALDGDLGNARSGAHQSVSNSRAGIKSFSDIFKLLLDLVNDSRLIEEVRLGAYCALLRAAQHPAAKQPVRDISQIDQDIVKELAKKYASQSSSVVSLRSARSFSPGM